jgi:hypothetical protein
MGGHQPQNTRGPRDRPHQHTSPTQGAANQTAAPANQATGVPSRLRSIPAPSNVQGVFSLVQATNRTNSTQARTHSRTHSPSSTLLCEAQQTRHHQSLTPRTEYEYEYRCEFVVGPEGKHKLSWRNRPHGSWLRCVNVPIVRCCSSIAR